MRIRADPAVRGPESTLLLIVEAGDVLLKMDLVLMGVCISHTSIVYIRVCKNCDERCSASTYSFVQCYIYIDTGELHISERQRLARLD